MVETGRAFRTGRMILCATFLGSALLDSIVRGDDGLQSLRGLLAEYRSANEAVVRRFDPDVHFAWGADSPAPGIGPEGFSVKWSGTFLQREDVPVTFHAYMAGELSIEIGGQKVLAGTSGEATWVSGEPVRLLPGFNELNIKFRKIGATARVGLYWSSDAFPLEPVSTFLLSPGDDVAELLATLRELDHGRKLFEAHRCGRCHVAAGEDPGMPAPALWGVTEGLSSQWLIAKLCGTNHEAASSFMPQFGLTEQEAADVAAFLTRLGTPHELSPVPAIKASKEPQPTGKELLVSIGCLACHKVGELGNVSPHSGPDLSRIGEKRSGEWLSTWLSQPDKLNPQHRMPVFKLTPTERALLVRELTSLVGPDLAETRFDKVETSGPAADRGRELVKTLRCANCHKLPAIEINLAGLPTLEMPVGDWSASCLGEMPDKTHGRPVFPQVDRDALRKYVESRANVKAQAPSDFDRGQLVLERRNCLGCHERDGAAGIVPTAGQVAAREETLRGLSEALIPPNLTAIGDKLLPEYLGAAVSGEQKEPRLPWLKVRMPRFQHTPEEKQALLAYLTGHDRIPDTAPNQLELQPVERDDQTLLLGRRLVGVGGFACIACHKMADYEPRNTALGTRGSDLMNVAGRMRAEYFLRWTRSPLRIVPGMEMPSYLRPVHGVLDDRLDLQFATLWTALSDPNFEPPTNPTQVEQFLVVQPGEQPRIVRDVFTLPGVEKTEPYQGVARAFAVGFDNGHSILFDLDTAQVRGWAYGDFARQRTEGKSWYWDLAGTILENQPQALGEIVLRKGDGTLLPLAAEGEDRPVAPRRYQLEADAEGRECVKLEYRLNVRVDGHPVHLDVTEKWRVEKGDSGSGWGRSIELAGEVPLGYVPAVVTRPSKTPRFNARLLALKHVYDGYEVTPEGQEIIPFTGSNPNWAEHMHYACNLPAYVPAQAVVLPGVNPAPSIPAANPLLSKSVTTLPGYVGRRLDVPKSAMPTAIGFDRQGAMYFTSLKGHVYRVDDANADGIEVQATVFEEGLAAPFGVLEDGDGILVAHKPELLRLVDTDSDGRADKRDIVADGWGYTDNYHDWTTGPVRDAAGRTYLALGSDYQQQDRPLEHARWRGKALRINSDGSISPIANELRFPQGIALDPQGRLFVTDQQGHGNPFNELNQIIDGRSYGVPARLDKMPASEPALPAVRVPHPWTRSVNGIFFLPPDHASPFAGHAIGCEYNGRFLVRYSMHDVSGELQGAVYPFTRPTWESDDQTFVGPICGAVAPSGDILIGSIHDSGWLGGLNVGEIVRLSRTREELPNGIREVRAVPTAKDNGPHGLAVEFIHPLNAKIEAGAELFSVLGYTRVWEGSYATEDSGRHEPVLSSVVLSPDRRTATLRSVEYKPGYVYEVRLVGSGTEDFFPTFAAYSLNRLP